MASSWLEKTGRKLSPMMQPNLPIALGLPELLKSPTIGSALGTHPFLLGGLRGGESVDRRNRSTETENLPDHRILGQVNVHAGAENLKSKKRRHLIFLIFEARDEKIQLFARFRKTDIGIRF